MIKTGLNVFDDTEALLIKTLFPEKIENKSDKHECSRKQVDDQSIERRDIDLLSIGEGFRRL